MNQKQCLKCGHNAEFPGAPPLACPKCGAIYSKVEQALADQGSERTSAAGPASRLPVTQATVVDVHTFAADMRSDSLYPTWRMLVGIATVVAYVMALVILLGAIFGSKDNNLTFWGGIVLAVLIVIFAKAGKELNLILADLSDATVRIAARAEQRE